MAFAAISSSAAGWQPLITDVSAFREALTGRPNVPSVIPTHASDLTLVAAPATTSIPTGATGVGVNTVVPIVPNFPPEVIQFIQLAQLGWGTKLGAGVRIMHWAAAVLLRDMLTAYVNQGAPRFPTLYPPNG